MFNNIISPFNLNYYLTNKNIFKYSAKSGEFETFYVKIPT